MMRFAGLIALAAVGLSAAAARAEIIFGMTAGGSGSGNPGLALVSFDSASPGTINTIGAFAGLTAGHALRSIDFRPATGQLYGISTDNATGTQAQLYTINLTNAALTAVGTGFALGTNTSPRVEMDFNPTVDRIRIVTGATGTSGQTNNFRANPNDGALVATDTNLAYDATDVQAGVATYTVIGAAYSNNVAGALSTSLFAWEYNTDALLTIGGANGSPSPNTGSMFTVNGPSSALTFAAGLGMDISGGSGTLFVTHDNPADGTVMGLFTRNTTSGAEMLVGMYPTGTFILDISVQPTAVPEPATLALTGLAAIGFAARIRRKRAA